MVLGDEKINYQSAQSDLLCSYVSRILGTFPHLEISRKDEVLENLENIVNFIEDKRLADEVLSSQLPYDPKVAIKIRQEAGYHLRTNFVQALGLDNSGYVQIGKFETGAQISKDPLRGKVGRIYFGWLKEHGYNPLDL
jgi:hypothetical protein